MGVFHIFWIAQILPNGHSHIVKEEWVLWEVTLSYYDWKSSFNLELVVKSVVIMTLEIQFLSFVANMVIITT